MFFWRRNAQVTSVEKPQFKKKISIKNEKYKIHIWSWESFKDKQSFYIISPLPIPHVNNSVGYFMYLIIWNT